MQEILREYTMPRDPEFRIQLVHSMSVIRDVPMLNRPGEVSDVNLEGWKVLLRDPDYIVTFCFWRGREKERAAEAYEMMVKLFDGEFGGWWCEEDYPRVVEDVFYDRESSGGYLYAVDLEQEKA